VQPVLITGARGFIGRNVARRFAALGRPVVGIGHGAIAPSRMAQWGIDDWVNGDVDHANLQLLQRRSGPFGWILHLAGGAHVGRSFENPAEDFQRTAVAASHLLEWVRLNCPETPVVLVSSAAVYGAGHSGPIPEGARLDPFSPYGAHKAILEALARSYCANFGLRVAICRLFSVYGEGLEKQLVYDLCRKCAASDGRITLGGTGGELRDWIHVDDVARLLWLVKERCSTDCFVVNGGRGVATSVSEVAGGVIAAWGGSIEAVFDGKGRPGDPASLVADATLARSIGFVPEVDLEAGLARVVRWYRASQP
jgi:UDP-glucose 4-epimerase